MHQFGLVMSELGPHGEDFEHREFIQGTEIQDPYGFMACIVAGILAPLNANIVGEFWLGTEGAGAYYPVDKSQLNYVGERDKPLGGVHFKERRIMHTEQIAGQTKKIEYCIHRDSVYSASPHYSIHITVYPL